MTHEEFLQKVATIQTGDAFISHGTATISQAIEYFMEEYRKNFHVDPGVIKLLTDANGKVMTISHCATFIWDAGDLWLYGSIDWGYKPIIFTDHYTENDNLMVLRDGLTEIQQHNLVVDAMKMTGEATLYPYWILAMWALYVATHWKYLLSGGGHRAEDCFKACYELKRAILPDKYNLNPLYVTCYDCIRADNQIIIDNRK
jgi:hypothetical protein